MKYLFAILFLLNVQNCNHEQLLPVVKATSQQWFGGAAGSGHGTYYRIYINMKSNDDLRFDSLWVNSKRLSLSSGTASSNDTLLLQFNEFIRGTMTQSNDTDRSPDQAYASPLKTNAQGVLGYYFKGQRQYFPIQAWIVLKPLYYP